MPKKKFSDTRVGKFLANIAPHIFDVTASILPNAGILKLIKGLIKEDKVITPKNKEEALKLLEIDLVEMQEVSKRWQSDMKSDSWLSKNVRPLTLVFFSISYIIGWFLNYPLDSITGLLSLIVAAYFGSRGFEKLRAIGK
tara:strand:+ start:1116 stop:1535 length:420 start_codon:yes stop_codon:yes gene_type:complete